jgi:dolichyl-phosphate beta-glucosyltransferase
MDRVARAVKRSRLMSNHRPYLSIVIPAHNEAERIVPTLRAVAAWVAGEGLAAEVLVVDDGSTDATRAIVEAIAAQLPVVRLAASTPHAGEGHAVRVGMQHAAGRLRLVMAADGSVPIDELPRALARIADGAAVVDGVRRAAGSPTPWLRRAWARLASQVVPGHLRAGFGDAAGTFKLFTAAAARRIFARVASDGWGLDLEILVRARKLGCRIDEVAVAWHDEPRATGDLLAEALRASADVARLRRAAQASASHPRLERI